MKYSNVMIKVTAGALISGLMFTGVGFKPSTTSIALIKKIIFVVEKKSENESYAKATLGDRLTSGDFVRTGEKSLAIIKFTDNSILRLRETTEMQITGEVTGGAFSKNVQLKSGGFGFEIKKQQNEKFIFSSPTSVASIRGTKGGMLAGNGTDTLLVTEGLVNLKNSVSQKEVDVPAGMIAFSSDDGSVTARTATDKELKQLSRVISGETDNELKLELKDSQGNKKELKLKYKQ